MDFNTDTGLKVLGITQIHGQVTSLSGNARWQAQDSAGNGANQGVGEAIPKARPVIGVYQLVVAFELHLTFTGIARSPGKPVGRLPENTNVEGRRQGFLHSKTHTAHIVPRTNVTTAEPKEWHQGLLLVLTVNGVLHNF